MIKNLHIKRSCIDLAKRNTMRFREYCKYSYKYDCGKLESSGDYISKEYSVSNFTLYYYKQNMFNHIINNKCIIPCSVKECRLDGNYGYTKYLIMPNSLKTINESNNKVIFYNTKYIRFSPNIVVNYYDPWVINSKKLTIYMSEFSNKLDIVFDLSKLEDLSLIVENNDNKEEMDEWLNKIESGSKLYPNLKSVNIYTCDIMDV